MGGGGGKGQVWKEEEIKWSVEKEKKKKVRREKISVEDNGKDGRKLKKNKNKWGEGGRKKEGRREASEEVKSLQKEK